jgi:uncharacterized sulfatase
VELVDLYPTLADLAGLTPPKNLEGFSLRPLLEDPAAAWDHAAYTQVWRGKFPGHSLRTDRWRYTEWESGSKGAELYDHQADPAEDHNLAADPQFAATLADLKKQLEATHPAPVEPGSAPKEDNLKWVEKKSAVPAVRGCPVQRVNDSGANNLEVAVQLDSLNAKIGGFR